MARPRELAGSLACLTNWVARGGKREMARSDGEVRRVPLWMVAAVRCQVSGRHPLGVRGRESKGVEREGGRGGRIAKILPDSGLPGVLNG